MNLTYPLEVYNTYDLVRGRGFEIGNARILFPSFMPKTRSHVVKYLTPLNDRRHYIEAKILRRGRVIALASPCLNYPLNQYIFNEGVSDREIVRYLRVNKGWKPKQLRQIEHSLQYVNSRKVIDEDLYRWEYDTIPHVRIPFEDQKHIIDKEIAEHGIPYNYEVTQFTHDTNYGHCQLLRRSGWVSIPFKIVIALNVHAPMYVVLHEIAHLLSYYYYRSNLHSPIFMKLYSDLLYKYMDINFLPSMKEAGLFQGMRNGQVEKQNNRTR